MATLLNIFSGSDGRSHGIMMDPKTDPSTAYPSTRGYGKAPSTPGCCSQPNLRLVEECAGMTVARGARGGMKQSSMQHETKKNYYSPHAKICKNDVIIKWRFKTSYCDWEKHLIWDEKKKHVVLEKDLNVLIWWFWSQRLTRWQRRYHNQCRKQGRL